MTGDLVFTCLSTKCHLYWRKFDWRISVNSDTVVSVSLPSVAVIEVVVGLRVLLASNTHCDMCIPLLQVQSINMKPTGKKTKQ